MYDYVQKLGVEYVDYAKREGAEDEESKGEYGHAPEFHRARRIVHKLYEKSKTHKIYGNHSRIVEKHEEVGCSVAGHCELFGVEAQGRGVVALLSELPERAKIIYFVAPCAAGGGMSLDVHRSVWN